MLIMTKPQAPMLCQVGCMTPGAALGYEMSRVLLVLVTSLLASHCAATLEVLLALQTHFRTGCVYLLQSHNTTDVEQRRITLKLMSTRGRQMAASVFYEPNQLKPRTCFYNRPLHVLLSADESTKLSLAQLSAQRGVMADAVWILFLETSVDQFLEDVYIPVDCEFLVAQRRGENAILLTEVYRMEKGLPLQRQHFGTWDKNGLLVSRESLVRRRSNFHSYTITATSFNKPPLVLMDDKEVKMIGGLFGAAWIRLERRLNFTTRYIVPPLRSWGEVLDNNKTTGVVGLLADGDAQVGVFAMLMTSGRMDVMDFTTPLLSPQYQLLVRQPDVLQLKWNTYLAPFSWTLWLILLLLTLFIALLLQAFYCLGRRHDFVEATSVLFRFRDSLFYVISAFCQQGMATRCPQMDSCRVVYLTTYLTAVILLASYSATLISFLTVPTVELPFNNLEEFLIVGTHELGTLKDSTVLTLLKDSEVPLYRQVYRRFLQPRYGTSVPDSRIGLDRVCSSKYVFMAMYTDTLQEMRETRCRVTRLPKGYFPSSLSFGLALNCPFKDFLNYHLLALQEDGELHKLRKTLFAPPNEKQEVTAGWSSVEMQHLVPILTALGSGVVLGAICLLLEHGVRRWVCGKWRTMIRKKRAAAVGNRIAT